jgi:phage shock protein A
MLLDVRGVREFARATRAVAALTTINEQRIAAHRRTLMELRQQRDAMEASTHELERRGEATRPRALRSARSPRGKPHRANRSAP